LSRQQLSCAKIYLTLFCQGFADFFHPVDVVFFLPPSEAFWHRIVKCQCKLLGALIVSVFIAERTMKDAVPYFLPFFQV
jgi:hypothetical protein